jgi:hypothetical protein
MERAVNAYLALRLYNCATLKVRFGRKHRGDELQNCREDWIEWCLEREFLHEKVGMGQLLLLSSCK